MNFEMLFLKSLRPQFEANFQRSEDFSCWLWHGRRNSSGYGCISSHHEGRRVSILAHRLSLAYSLGSWPDKKTFACHHCDTPACVNPNHLYAGTSSDNNKDRHAKGRTKSWMTKGHMGCRREMSEDQAHKALELYFGDEGGGVVAAIRRDPHGINYNNMLVWFRATGHQIYSYVIQGNRCTALHSHWVSEARSLWFSKGAQGFYCAQGTATAKWTRPSIEDYLNVKAEPLKQFLACNSYPEVWKSFFDSRPYLRRFLSIKNRFNREFETEARSRLNLPLSSE